MMFTFFVSTALAGGGSEAAYVEQQLVREVHDSRHYETSYVSSVVGDQVVTTPQQNVVGTMTMEQGMASSTAQATPLDEVDALINQVADENGLEIADQLDGGIKVSRKEDPQAGRDKESADLLNRLEARKH